MAPVTSRPSHTEENRKPKAPIILQKLAKEGSDERTHGFSETGTPLRGLTVQPMQEPRGADQHRQGKTTCVRSEVAYEQVHEDKRT